MTTTDAISRAITQPLANVPKEDPKAGPKTLFERFTDSAKKVFGLARTCSAASPAAAAAFEDLVPEELLDSPITDFLTKKMPCPPNRELRDEVSRLDLLQNTPVAAAPESSEPAKPAPQRWQPLSLPPIAPAAPRVTRQDLDDARAPLAGFKNLEARRNHPGCDQARYAIGLAHDDVGADAPARATAKAILSAARGSRKPAEVLDFFLNTPILAMVDDKVAAILIDIVSEMAVAHAENVAAQLTKVRDERLASWNAVVSEAQDFAVASGGDRGTLDLADKLKEAIPPIADEASESSSQDAIKKVLREAGYAGPNLYMLRDDHSDLFRKNVLDKRTLEQVVKYLANAEAQVRVAA
jgi:hypothetical protein